MAKLYAELTSDKGGRVIGKGGDNFMQCKITYNGKIIATVEYFEENLHIADVKDDLPIVINGFQVQ